MSNSHSQNYRKVILKPCSSFKFENEEEGKALYDFFHRAPVGFVEALVLAQKMAGMNMKPTPQAKDELPEVEKEEDDTYISFKVTFVGGLRKEDVKVLVKNGVVFIEIDRAGVKEKKAKQVCIKHAFDTPDCCKLKDVKAKLTNGVLKVVLETVDEDDDVHRFEGVHQFEVEME